VTNFEAVGRGFDSLQARPNHMEQGRNRALPTQGPCTVYATCPQLRGGPTEERTAYPPRLVEDGVPSGRLTPDKVMLQEQLAEPGSLLSSASGLRHLL